MKKKKKKSSENDQLSGHFQSFFIYFLRPPDPKSEKKNPVNQQIKNLALDIAISGDATLYKCGISQVISVSDDCFYLRKHCRP